MKIFKRKNLCQGCDALCCKYITIEIDTPQTEKDFKRLKQFLAHKNIEISVEEDASWWIKFITQCKQLNKENKCNTYKKRPLPCKEFSSKTCPFNNKANESLIVFTSDEDMDKYIEKVYKKSRHTLTTN